MPTVTRTFSVNPPPEVVIPYLADFTHADCLNRLAQRNRLAQ